MNPQHFILFIPMLIALTQQQALHTDPQEQTVHFDQSELWVSDTSEFADFRVQLLNPADSAVYIQQIKPSCGCVLATVQRTRATREKSAEIYVAVVTERMSNDQPVVIDVYTSQAPEVPLRLWIRKLKPDKPNDSTDIPNK
jgi:hypothetical protein